MTKEARTARKADTVNQLFDFATDHPDGFTFTQLRDALGWDYSRFTYVKRWLRELFAEDGYTLICIPQAAGLGWLYKLTNEYADARTWANIRTLDIVQRIETLRNVASTLVHATDPSSLEGEIALLTHKGFTRLWEDIRDVKEKSQRLQKRLPGM